MADYLVPALGVQGVWTLSAPFTSSIVAGASYKLIATRYLTDIVSDGGNPYQDIYQVAGLSETTYQDDTTNNVCVLSLQSTGGTVVKVPNSYITSYPSSGGVPYTSVILGVSLGAIPDALDLTLIKSQIVDLILNKIGLNATVQQAVVSTTKNVTQDDYATAESVRLARITDNTTDYAKYIAAEARAATLQAQVTVLENYIIANPPATTTTTITTPTT